jgi:hypothetical protein
MTLAKEHKNCNGESEEKYGRCDLVKRTICIFRSVLYVHIVNNSRLSILIMRIWIGDSCLVGMCYDREVVWGISLMHTVYTGIRTIILLQHVVININLDVIHLYNHTTTKTCMSLAA